MLPSLIRTTALLVAGAISTMSPSAHAELTVLMSGGFALAYQAVLPEFERTSGIHVVTKSGASQGTGPSTIKSQLDRGVHTDVVILSREGLDELITAGRIAKGSDVGLATTPLGAAVRTGSPVPDVTTPAGLKDSLLQARLITMPGSTSGKYIHDNILPRLGIADKVNVKVMARGIESTQLLAAGESEMALGPVSELVHLNGVHYIGKFPDEFQLIQEFTAAIVRDSTQAEDAKRLIAFLSSSAAKSAIQKAGMEPVIQRPRTP